MGPDPDALPPFAAKIGVKGSIEELCQNQVSLSQESLCTPMGPSWEGDSLFSPPFNLGTHGFPEPPRRKNRLLLCLYWLVLLDWTWAECLTLALGSDRIPVELFQILKDDAVESAALNIQYARAAGREGGRPALTWEGVGV